MQAIANKRWTPEGQIETRYWKARKEWDDRMGSAVIQARNWRLATLLALGLVFVSLVGTIYLGAQPKAIPHIVQVDKIGAPTYLGPVGQSMRDYHPAEATVKYHLRRFVDETRSISSDGAVVRRNWTDAYSIITPNAANQLSAHAERNDPLKRSRDERVTVDVASIVQISKETWQADWEEKTWDKAGNEVASAVWRGSFKVIVRVPESEEQIAANPIGLYIDEFHWSKVGA
jgi:type IV secretory pathway TrbF-like protein